MTDLYELQSAGAVPVDLATMRSYLKDPPTADDTLITSMLTVATEWGEKYTAREFRANTWKLSIDFFPERIGINRNPVDTITSVQHRVSDVLTAVPTTDYYLKKLSGGAQILLVDGKSWPTNTDDREQAIEIVFVTKAYPCLETIKLAIMQHVAYMYDNRGDCDCDTAGRESGASALYGIFAMRRV